METDTVAASIASALTPGIWRRIAAAMRLAVVKSGSRSVIWIDAAVRESSRHFALHDSAMRDAPDIDVVLLHFAAARLEIEAADGKRALRRRVHLAVGGHKRRLQQCAALQRFGVANRGNGNVNLDCLLWQTRAGRLSPSRRRRFSRASGQWAR